MRGYVAARLATSFSARTPGPGLIRNWPPAPSGRRLGREPAPEGSGFQLDLRIFGSEGMLLLEVEREREELRRDDQQDRSLYPTRGEGDYACDSPPANFIDLILGRTSENHAPGWAAMRPVEQLDAAYRSVLPGAPERVRPALESCDASAHLSVEL